MRLQADVQFLGMEACLTGAVDSLVEIADAGERKEVLSYVVLNPRGGAKGVERIGGEVALLDGLGVLNNLPAVTGQVSPVDDEDANGSAAGGFFILVGPAAVVGEGFGVEELLIIGRRLGDDDEGDLAVKVDVLAVGAGVVVPLVLGRVNAVADEDDG